MNEFENLEKMIKVSMKISASKIIVGQVRETSVIETF